MLKSSLTYTTAVSSSSELVYAEKERRRRKPQVEGEKHAEGTDEAQLKCLGGGA